MKIIQPFRGGSRSAREKLNAIRESVSVTENIRGDEKYIAVRRDSSGVTISLNVDAVRPLIPRDGPPLKQAIIVSVGNDVLTCNYIFPDKNGNPTPGDAEILVLKPWTLRRTPFDGLTVNGVAYTYSNAYTRSATPTGGSAETQKITPDYFEDAIIYVAHINEASVAGVSGDVIDVNVDGRAWAVPAS
jgi:hypothetical protein